jgi:hypothetical protein
MYSSFDHYLFIHIIACFQDTSNGQEEDTDEGESEYDDEMDNDNDRISNSSFL